MTKPRDPKSLLRDLTGQRVTVFGLGRFGGGVGVTRYLAEHGAIVTVADEATEQQLQASVSALSGVDIARWLFGVTPEQLADCELLVVNPAIRPGHPVFDVATRSGIPVTSEAELFCVNNRGSLIAVTGSNGKSTTSAMIAHVLRSSGYACYLGGNIGGSLLSEVDGIRPDEFVVLELSSFQLARMSIDAYSPTVAVVTNLVPNHLDWHNSLDDYRAAKKQLVSAVAPSGNVVLCSGTQFDDWHTRAKRWSCGEDSGEDGVFLTDDSIVFRSGSSEEATPPWALRVPGSHNVQNSLAAAASAFALGVSPSHIAGSLKSFVGLPYRLQFVGEFQGRTFINDSVATTPESAVAALRAFSGPIVLIAGGSDKGADLTPLAAEATVRARVACWVGSTAKPLFDAAQANDGSFNQAIYEGLESAFRAAVDVSEPGDIVILSPGCASFGMYANFEQRGKHFDQLVHQLNRSESSDE